VTWLFAPGFFASSPVHVALVVGGISALVCGIVGTFTVLRGQSYSGHALADLSVTGGSASFLANISPLVGFAGTGVLAAGVMDMISNRQPRGRDLATGIVRGAGLGLAALFLYWDATSSSTTGATITILFGSMFTVGNDAVPLVAAFGLPALAVVAVLYRPLLLSSVSPELAAARGVRTRLAGLACLALRRGHRHRLVSTAPVSAGRCRIGLKGRGDRPTPGPEERGVSSAHPGLVEDDADQTSNNARSQRDDLPNLRDPARRPHAARPAGA